jgi:cell division septation protein DedD
MLNTRYEQEDDLHEDSQGTEISVGTTSIVGIFFVLVLICAIFFGIGYTLGRRQGVAQSLNAAQIQSPAAPSPALASTPKPSPGSVADAPPPAPETHADAPAEPASDPQLEPAPAVVPQPRTKPAPDKPAPVRASTPAPATAVGIFVQIAALTHQQDADNEVSELRKRGFDVFTRRLPGDNFIRIQIGPYVTRKEAKEMCDRLLASGYNAIIK